MYIILTERSSGQPIALAAQTILLVKKHAQNRLETHVMTGIMGSNGHLQTFSVEESVEEVFRRLMAAQRWQMLQPPTVKLEELGLNAARANPLLSSNS